MLRSGPHKDRTPRRPQGLESEKQGVLGAMWLNQLGPNDAPRTIPNKSPHFKIILVLVPGKIILNIKMTFFQNFVMVLEMYFYQ